MSRALAIGELHMCFLYAFGVLSFPAQEADPNQTNLVFCNKAQFSLRIVRSLIFLTFHLCLCFVSRHREIL